MAAEQATGYAFKATWYDNEGNLVSSTDPATMCWFPRKPWTLRIVREGYAHIVPCRECPGCLEFERRRLAGRLAEKYQTSKPGRRKCPGKLLAHTAQPASGASIRLYLIRIYAEVEEHAALSHKLHRRRALELEPGYWRLGATSFAVLARSKAVVPLLLRRLGLRCRVEPILLRRGRRAWRGLTMGILVTRQAYGENLNRWYCRGLPKAERETWEVDRHAGAKGYKRASSPRAWKGGQVVLVPPEVWRLRRADRSTVRRDFASAGSPEAVARVMGLVTELLAKRDISSLISPAARPVLSVEAVKAWYADMAERRRAARTKDERTSDLLPSSEKGGYASSVHSSGAPPPRAGAGEHLYREMAPFNPLHLSRLPEDSLTELNRKQWLKRRERRALDAHLEGLRKRIAERKHDD